VLPFVNLSGDPEQAYFSDGITEDIMTELSRFSELIVIARNSSFQYKGKAVDIRQVGRELGARYVLEGSVRRSGVSIPITGQLVDAMTGAPPSARTVRTTANCTTRSQSRTRWRARSSRRV
jgi:TolB-like protein